MGKRKTDVERLMDAVGVTTRRKQPALSVDGWIDIFASGHVHVRGSGPMRGGSLPCYNAGSKEAADELVVLACVLTRNGEGYAVPYFVAGEIESIDKAKERFKKCHDWQIAQRKAKKTLARSAPVLP